MKCTNGVDGNSVVQWTGSVESKTMLILTHCFT